MLHPNKILSWTLILFASISAQAQYVDLGTDQLPNDHDLVDDLIWYGDFLEFEGGYHVGDTAANFTVYDFDGNAMNFYEELEGDKPVILMSGSVSCLRFRYSFPNEDEQPGQAYFAADTFFDEYSDLYNVLFVYGIEAHPTDGNCPSNCPPTTSNDTTVLQAPDYIYRKWAMKTWMDSPDFHFPFNMYCDNPDNSVYNTFFQRPFGALVFNCDATVAMRGDWANMFFQENNDNLVDFAENYTACSIDWIPEEEIENNGEEEVGGNGDGENEEGTGEEEEEDNGEGENEEGTGEEEEEDNGEGENEEGTGEEEEEDNDPDYEGDPADLEDIIDEDTVVSVNDFTIQDEWNFYPNPAQNMVTLRVDKPTSFATYSLIDITGKVILTGQVNQNITQLDVSQFATGLYFVEMIGQNGKAARERLVIR